MRSIDAINFFNIIKNKMQDELEGFIAKNQIDCELDWDDESITVTKEESQYLIIFKKDIMQIWYSSPISGASRFPIEIINEEVFIKNSSSKFEFPKLLLDELMA